MNDLEFALKLLEFQQVQDNIEKITERKLDIYAVVQYLNGKCNDFSDVEEVVHLLDEEFLSQYPKILDRVVCEESVIPSNVPIILEKKKYKHKGEVWVVHQNDVDPFPSSPHAHNYDQNLVLHLGNGKMFRKREYIATVQRKQFLMLRKLITNISLPPLEY
ncbi:hypothetical protein [Psychromonas aquimarina]|uniref:hypothetical protein n=1 Tax=Psychromonas aquimarina TaxID=444919 RepID=UPI00048C5802|nr:hypothetical protein [Psychromonas aquimarina]